MVPASHLLPLNGSDQSGEVLELVERHLVQHVLDITNGNQAQAAKLLGITRKTLRSKIRALDIFVERSHRDHADG